MQFRSKSITRLSYDIANLIPELTCTKSWKYKNQKCLKCM